MLEDAGYKDVDGDGYRETKDGEKLSLRLTATTDYTPSTLAGKLMVGWFKQIGIKTVLSVGRPRRAHRHAVQLQGRHVRARLRHVSVVLDAGRRPQAQVGIYTPQQIEGWNDCLWTDPEYTKLNEEQKQAVDESERIPIVQEMQRMFYESAAYIVYAYPSLPEAYNTQAGTGGCTRRRDVGTVLYNYNNVDTYRFVHLKTVEAARRRRRQWSDRDGRGSGGGGHRRPGGLAVAAAQGWTGAGGLRRSSWGRHPGGLCPAERGAGGAEVRMGKAVLTVWNEDECRRVHEATKEVLAMTGVEVRGHAQTLGLYADAGARVEGTRVRIPEELVEEALAAAPRQWTVPSRGDAPSLTLADGFSSFGSGSDCLYMRDPDTGERRRIRSLTSRLWRRSATGSRTSTSSCRWACPATCHRSLTTCGPSPQC